MNEIYNPIQEPPERNPVDEWLKRVKEDADRRMREALLRKHIDDVLPRLDIHESEDDQSEEDMKFRTMNREAKRERQMERNRKNPRLRPFQCRDCEIQVADDWIYDPRRGSLRCRDCQLGKARAKRRGEAWVPHTRHLCGDCGDRILKDWWEAPRRARRKKCRGCFLEYQRKKNESRRRFQLEGTSEKC